MPVGIHRVEDEAVIGPVSPSQTRIIWARSLSCPHRL